jgi:hypothetical protein
MQRYRTRTGRFPSEWFLLNWPYEESWSYEHDDISLLPTPSMGNAWTPSLSKYTYVIRTATHDELLVQAIDIQDGDVVAEMDQAYITSDRETGFRQLRDYTCYKEDASPWRPTDAARFLRRLANAFDGFYHKCRHYPDTFDDVELHVAIGRHTENDPIAIPPKGAARWKPHGFAYTFTILRSGNHFLVQSSNDEGLEDYFVTDQTPPTLLKSGGRTP